MAYKVLLYEGNRLMLGRLLNVINGISGYSVVASYQDWHDALGQGKVFKPNLILVDIDNQQGINLITEFHDVFPGIPILCMSEQWSAGNAVHSVQAGAKGYLLKPFTGEELENAVKEFSNSTVDATTSHVMTFFSPKGKSGSTTLIANLALSIARKTNESVCIIDADLQFGDMALFFNIQPHTTITEAARDIKYLSPISFKDYFVPITPNVSVLCGTLNPSLIDKISIEALEKLVTMARSLFQYILIDVPAGFNPTSVAMAEMSEVTYIVSMKNDGFEMQHMRRAIEIFRDWKDVETRLKPVFTRVSPCNKDSLDALSAELQFPVEGIIPNEYMLVAAAANNGRMAYDIDADSNMAKSIGNLANKIINKHRIDWGKS